MNNIHVAAYDNRESGRELLDEGTELIVPPTSIFNSSIKVDVTVWDIGVYQCKRFAIKYLEMSVAAEAWRLDPFRHAGGIEIKSCVYCYAAPVCAVYRSKELSVAIDSEAIAVGIAPDFLQTQKVRSILAEKLVDFFKTFDEPIYIPADEKHGVRYSAFEQILTSSEIFVISCGHVGIESRQTEDVEVVFEVVEFDYTA